MLHNVNVPMSLNHMLKNDEFHVYFTTKERTRNKKSGSHTACTSARSVPRAPSVSAKTTPSQLRIDVGHSLDVRCADGAAERKCFTSTWNLLRHITNWKLPRALRGQRRGAGRRGLRGLASTVPRTLGRNTNTHEHAALKQTPQDSNTCTFFSLGLEGEKRKGLI